MAQQLIKVPSSRGLVPSTNVGQLIGLRFIQNQYLEKMEDLLACQLHLGEL